MRLLLHAGLGKTGTTAFQHFCDVNRNLLLEDGFLNVGRNLQHLPRDTAPSGGIQVDRVEPLGRALRYLEASVERVSPDAHSVIWSNEAFSMSREPEQIIASLDQWIRTSEIFDQWDVYLVFRRQDQWIESAYRQWALKHKTYPGHTIMSPENYVDSVSYLLDYYQVALKWDSSSANLRACSYDSAREAGGIVDYLAQRMALPHRPEYKELGKTLPAIHRSLSADLSMLVALYNMRFEGPNDPRDFLELIRTSGAEERSRDRQDTCFISTETRSAVLERYQVSNDRLTTEYFADGERFSDAPVKVVPQYQMDYEHLLSRILDILAQARSAEPK